VNKIKQLRIDRGWTQDDLGTKLNVKRAAISKYESGKIPLTGETLKLLSDIFDVSTDYILGKTDIKNPHQTIAAHRTDDPKNPLPPEALQSIEDFKKFIYKKYGVKYD
jgi:Predicted transcriptional regulators